MLWNINSFWDDGFRTVISLFAEYRALILIKVFSSPLKYPSKIYGFCCCYY